ncbi:MAG TPA: peptidyl-prolyl cis-trans isomerase [Gammaproteobacteria bacterium]
MHELITLLENYFTLRGALLSYQQLPWGLEQQQAAQLRQAVAKELTLARRALATESDAPHEHEAAVQEGVESLHQQLQHHGSTTASLARAGLDGGRLGKAIATELHVAAVLEQVVAEARPDEAQLRALYEQNRARFVTPERREAFQILITLNDDYADNRRDRALARITQLARQLAGEGANFGEMALRHSECPSAVEAGRLGMVIRGQLYPDLDERLFAMSQGEISGVVESPLGYHLLRCGDIEPPRALSWDEVKPSLSQRITERMRRRRLQEWLNSA